MSVKFIFNAGSHIKILQMVSVFIFCDVDFSSNFSFQQTF